MQQPKHRKSTNAPRPRTFTSEPSRDYARRIETVGRAVDEVVGDFVAITDGCSVADTADLRRLAAATRRLWGTALALYRHGREGGS